METQPLLQTESGMSRRKKIACYTILLTVILERIAFYAVVGNLVMFLTHIPMNFVPENASTVLLLFTGLAYFTSIFGGWIADSILGRFWTIFLAFLLYMGCYAFLPMLNPNWRNIHMNDKPPFHENISFICAAGNTDPNRLLFSENCAFAVLGPLCIMAIGIGAVKANIAPFGADQIRGEGQSASRFFFNWFYWCINIGALIGVGALSYFQQTVNFFWGYLVPGIFLLLASAIFTFGGRFYTMKPPVGSVLTKAAKILCQSCLRRKWNIRQSSMDSSTEHSVTSQDDVQINPGCLDRAKIRFGGSFEEPLVEDVKKLGKIILIFLTMVPYWLVYYQMQTMFVVQGLHMNLRMWHNCSDEMQNLLTVPAAFLQLFDILALILLIPIFDRLIYPFLDRRGYQMSLRFKICLGMIISALSMFTAAGVEWIRHDIVQTHYLNQTLDMTTYVAADMSVFWQIPQYFLIGVSEVLASITGLEMAYVEAPKSMQGIVLGIFWSVNGLASFLGIGLLAALHSLLFHYTSDDHSGINCPDGCHLDIYFLALAGLQICGLFLFYMCARWLKMGKRDPHPVR